MEKVVVFGQGGYILAKSMYSGKSVCYRKKEVVFGQKWLCSCKSGCLKVKVVLFG